MSSNNHDASRNHSLLSDTSDVVPKHNNKHRFDDHFDSRDSSAVDLPDAYNAPSSSVGSSFLPLSPSLQQRLFPPTAVARTLWLLAFFGVLFIMLLSGYEIGKRLTHTAPPAPVTPSRRSIVVLVSIDGFRASYLNDYPTLVPTLKAMQYAGSYARRMQSCFPSLTFPNHWSVVTGLYTEEHGITSNNIYDPVMDATFNMQTLDPAWWGGEPIWNTAIKQNLRANVMYCQTEPRIITSAVGTSTLHWHCCILMPLCLFSLGRVAWDVVLCCVVLCEQGRAVRCWYRTCDRRSGSRSTTALPTWTE